MNDNIINFNEAKKKYSSRTRLQTQSQEEKYHEKYWPLTAREYLVRCKEELEPYDYLDVLRGIADNEIYEELEPGLQEIVDTYFTHF